MSTAYGNTIRREIEQHSGMNGGEKNLDKQDLWAIQALAKLQLMRQYGGRDGLNNVQKLLIERVRNLKKAHNEYPADDWERGWDEGLDEVIEIIKASSEIGDDNAQPN